MSSAVKRSKMVLRTGESRGCIIRPAFSSGTYSSPKGFLYRTLASLTHLICFLISLPLRKGHTYYLYPQPYFGHQIAEGSLLLEYVSSLAPKERCRVHVIAEGPAANVCLERVVQARLQTLAVSSSRFWGYAAWGQMLLDELIGFGSAIQRVTMSMADSDHSEVCQSWVPTLTCKDANLELAKVGLVSESFVVVTNRSDDYSKWNEAKEKNHYRNFSFAPIASAISSATTGKAFVRLGTANHTDGSGETWQSISDLRSKATQNPCLDLAIQQNASGYFGAVSGPYSTFLLLKKPTAAINVLPLLASYPTEPQKLLLIPKLIYDINRGELVPLKDMVKMPLVGITHTDDYRRQGLECVENSPDLVADFLREWLALCGWGPESDNVQLEREIRDRATALRRRLNLPGLVSLPLSLYAHHPELF